MIISLFLVVFSPYTAFLPLIYIIYRVLSKREQVSRNPWNIGLLILFAWSLISGILNRSLLSTVLSAGFFMYFCLSVYLENNFNTEYKIEKIYKYISYFSVFAALFGIFEKIFFAYYDSKLWKALLGIKYGSNIPHRIYSTFGNPNVAGTWFAAMVLVGIYFCSRTSGREKLFYQASSALFVAALLLTGSRGAYMGLLAGLLAYYLLRKNNRSFKYLIIFFILFAIAAFLPSQILYAKNLMGHELDTSVSSRNAIWDGCIKMFLLKPIAGWGLTGIYDHGLSFMNYHTKVFHGHNIWITLATTLGFVGLSVYIYMKFYLYAGLKTLYNNNSNIAPLLAAIQMLILCHGFVDFTIMTPQAGLLFIATSSFIDALAAGYNHSPVQEVLSIFSPLPALSKIAAVPLVTQVPTLSRVPVVPIVTSLVSKSAMPKVSTIKYKTLSKIG